MVNEPDDKLEMLRKKRLQELQAGQALQEGQLAAQASAQEQFEAQKQMLLRRMLTPEAKERLGRLRIARPELAANIEQQLLALSQSGRIRGKIDDYTFKQLLAKIMPKRRDIKITRVGDLRDL